MSISETTKSGDRIATLEALRDLIAERIEATTAARDTAALVKQFRDTMN